MLAFMSPVASPFLGIHLFEPKYQVFQLGHCIKIRISVLNSKTSLKYFFGDQFETDFRFFSIQPSRRWRRRRRCRRRSTTKCSRVSGCRCRRRRQRRSTPTPRWRPSWNLPKKRFFLFSIVLCFLSRSLFSICLDVHQAVFDKLGRWQNVILICGLSCRLLLPVCFSLHISKVSFNPCPTLACRLLCGSA